MVILVYARVVDVHGYVWTCMDVLTLYPIGSKHALILKIPYP